MRYRQAPGPVDDRRLWRPYTRGHVAFADQSFCIGGAAARDSYLKADTFSSSKASRRGSSSRLAFCRKMPSFRSLRGGRNHLSWAAGFGDPCHGFEKRGQGAVEKPDVR